MANLLLFCNKMAPIMLYIAWGIALVGAASALIAKSFLDYFYPDGKYNRLMDMIYEVTAEMLMSALFFLVLFLIFSIFSVILS